MHTGYIYKITNLINGKMYIGKTIHEPPELRWKEHKRERIKERVKNRPLYRALNKYGVENFSFEIIEKVEDNLEEKEKYYIEYYRTYVGYKDCKGYNGTLGGDGAPYLNLNEKEVIEYHVTTGEYCVGKTAEYFNVERGTIKKILKKYNIIWFSSIDIHKINLYLSQGAIIQVDPTNSYVINMFSSYNEANENLNKHLKNDGIFNACTKSNTHKAFGYYWYKEEDLPGYIIKDGRLYSNIYS